MPTRKWKHIPSWINIHLSHLELYSHHVKRGRAGQDGGVGPEKARQRCPTVPEEQGVPRQEAGAEVRFSHQDWDLQEGCFRAISLRFAWGMSGVYHNVVSWYGGCASKHATSVLICSHASGHQIIQRLLFLPFLVSTISWEKYLIRVFFAENCYCGLKQ